MSMKSGQTSKYLTAKFSCLVLWTPQPHTLSILGLLPSVWKPMPGLSAQTASWLAQTAASALQRELSILLKTLFGRR